MWVMSHLAYSKAIVASKCQRQLFQSCSLQCWALFVSIGSLEDPLLGGSGSGRERYISGRSDKGKI